MAEPSVSPQGSTPVPDPTRLTDEAIAKADKAIRDWVGGQLETLRERLHGVDTATELRLQRNDHIPDEIAAQVKCVTDVVEEKFRGVDNQFHALTDRMAEQKKDTKDAVDAAFQAAKDAVSLQTEASEKSIAKSEASTTKQLESLSAQSQTAIVGLSGQINDLKLAVERITAAKIGGIDQRSEIRNQGIDNRGAIALAISALLFVVTVVVAAVALTNGP